MWNKFCLKCGGGGMRVEMAQTMYTHVSKCKTNKTKEPPFPQEKKKNTTDTGM
jgi:hypothetical protein